MSQLLDWLPTWLLSGLAVVSLGNALFDRVDTEDLVRPPAPRPVGLHWVSADLVAPYLQDRVAFRRGFRRLQGELLWVTDDGNEDVVRGEGSWLFYADSFIASEGPEWVPRRPARSVVRLADQVEASGRRFLMVVAPNKASIYPGYLRSAARRQQTIQEGRLARVRRLALEGAPSGFVDVFDALRQRADSSGEPGATGTPAPLYYPADTHWNVLGAEVAAAEIVERLGGTWDEGLLQPVEVEGRFDLVGLLGLPDRGPRLSAMIYREGVFMQRTVDADDWVQYRSRSDDRPLLGNLVVLQDSFGDAFQMLLPSYFETSTFVSYGAALTEELATALDEAEIVIVVTVERSLMRLSRQNPTPLWSQTKQILERLERMPFTPATAREAEP